LPEKDPAVVDGATGYSLGDTDEELPDMAGRLTQLSQAPCEKTSPFSSAGRDHDEARPWDRTWTQ